MIKRLVAYRTGKKYQGKDGKQHESVNYFLELVNGTWIAVKPTFQEDYSTFKLISEVVDKKAK